MTVAGAMMKRGRVRVAAGSVIEGAEHALGGGGSG